MCRGNNDDYSPGHHHHRSHRLKLKAFAVNLSLSSKSSTTTTSVYLPEFLTLVFIPRINGGRFEINGSKVRPDSPAFLTLHRSLSPLSSDVEYSSKDRIVVSDGAAFEVHVGEMRLLKGVFREEEDEFDQWRLECRCTAADEGEFAAVEEVEVCVTEERGLGRVVVMREKLAVERRRRRRNKKKGFKLGLKEIPEERECDVEERELDVQDEVEEEEGGGSDGGDSVEMVESEMEGVGWAVDVGIWVACLGLGLLVSRASTRSLWRRKLLI